MDGEHIHIDGIVQGVGFRPFVYRLAHHHALSGWVRNSSRGVDIEVWGPKHALDAFAHALQAQAPPLARITHIQRHPLPANDLSPNADFVIIQSQEEHGFTLVSPDVATCSDCLRELFDPADRRYRYPFINCTNCGPRFSIIQALPYDRPQTTMARFRMCDSCQTEYKDPLDRRFHAQPNACPACGPHIWLEVHGEHVASHDKALQFAEKLLLEGRILAIKGLGGFHLACDARNHQAVLTLRARKQRPYKPLAVMMPDMTTLRHYCRASAAEMDALTSPAAPIVLLTAHDKTDMSPAIAPGQDTVGVMLPYTPLHHLLLRDLGIPLVMTSGNRRHEPIARTNAQARQHLSYLADAFLMHDRPIYNRNDDSVILVWHDKKLPLRRSRGFAPEPIQLTQKAPTSVLALGSFMKNTFCLLEQDKAFLSQHIGEMDDVRVWDFFVESVRRYRQLFGIHPERIAHDLHPEFTQIAESLLAQLDTLQTLPRVPIQHHHAHIASCLAEHGVTGPVIGLAWDGTGYGPDGTIWGGEFLIADLRTYQRLGRFSIFPLPGNEAAIRQPWRIALALTDQAVDDPAIIDSLFSEIPPNARQLILAQTQRALNTPQTSSAGRLFDAVAALIGLCKEVTYEGQAAMELETLARTATPATPWPISIHQNQNLYEIPVEAIIRAVIQDMQQGVSPNVIAARFHQTLITLGVDMATVLSEKTGLREIALSGGCFYNRLLLDGLYHNLQARGFVVYTHHQVPAGDGGLALGQAVIAAQQETVDAS